MSELKQLTLSSQISPVPAENLSSKMMSYRVLVVSP